MKKANLVVSNFNEEATMLKRTIIAATLALTVVASRPLKAQSCCSSATILTPDVERSGPRYGAIWLSTGIADTISAHFKNQKINSTTSLFGWEFERELLKNPGAMTPVSSLVLGVAGLDQGLVLPSATWIIGMRTRDDFELGIGPNVSLAGPALALTGGMTFHSGALNIPLDVAYVSSRIGTRVSLTTGFNIMK